MDGTSRPLTLLGRANVRFRTVSPTDIPACFDIERASYPADEAASKSALQYRQHHAAPYFRCAVLVQGGAMEDDDDVDDDNSHKHGVVMLHHDETDDGDETIVGYICSTRCAEFTEASMSVHDPSGSLLAIHSVVVQEQYRHGGIAKAMMKDYIDSIKSMQNNSNNSNNSTSGNGGGSDGTAPIEKIVLMAKSNLLGFYVQCGFSVIRPSAIVHGKDQWYDCELKLDSDDQSAGSEEGYPCWILDAFADKPASGNPAAVVLLPPGTDIDKEETIAWMQMVAKEFNLAETAFIWPKLQKQQAQQVECVQGEQEDCTKGEAVANGETANSVEKRLNVVDDNDDDEMTETGEMVSYYIRYFTRNGTHVDLCGHATLASAAVLFQTLPANKRTRDASSIAFEAKRNVLTAMPYTEQTNHSASSSSSSSSSWRHGRAGPLQVKMNFPKKALVEICASTDRSAVLSMFKSAFHMEDTAENILYLGVDEDGGDLLVELTRDGFLQLGYENVNYSALMEWDGYSRGVILCCREVPPASIGEQTDDGDGDDQEEEYEEEAIDFLSRFFGPKAGINEDPVTGSAHCTLAPYFASKLNKNILIGKQLSERGGTVTCVVEDDGVSIIGTAITTVRGSLFI